MKLFAIMFAALCILGMGEGSAWAQDCEPLKPSRTIDAEVRDRTEANANAVLKSLASGSLTNEYSRIEKNQVFRDVDEVHRWDSFIYVVCSILKTSDLSADAKIDRITKLYELKNQGPPPKQQTENNYAACDGRIDRLLRQIQDHNDPYDAAFASIKQADCGKISVHECQAVRGTQAYQVDGPNCPNCSKHGAFAKVVGDYYDCP